MSVKKVTPMMEQYLDIKNNYKDCLLFYRLGDFYELFYDDAKIASQVLEITLTTRNKKSVDAVPMCGVPHHAASEYIKTLVDKGYKVAICEQLEDAKLTKGMVKRDVVQVLTPGTLIDQRNRDEKSNHYLATVFFDGQYHLAYVDVSTGELKVTTLDNTAALYTEMSSLFISEIINHDKFGDTILDELTQRFSFTISHLKDIQQNTIHHSDLLKHLDINGQIGATTVLLHYLQQTQMRELSHIQKAESYESEHYLILDYNAKYNLELTSAIRTKQKKGSLLWQLDETKTAMGGRLLKKWLEKPLIQYEDIISRQQKVANFMTYYFEKLDIIQLLKSIYDLERLVAKVSFGSVNAREMIQLKQSLEQIPMIKSYLQQMNDDGIWNDMIQRMPDFTDLVARIDSAIVDDPPISVKDGGVIKKGYNELLDAYVDAMTNGKQWMAQLQHDEREKTGIKTLKIGYNRVFGYYIEVTKSQLSTLPKDRYERKQTLSNAERFVTPELKEKERLILEAEEKSVQLEYELFVQLREVIKTHRVLLQQLAKEVASLDVLQSFATVSETYHYVMPKLSLDNNQVIVQKGRHPVVERVIGIDKYVPNDIFIDNDKSLLLMTGPNMSGKSTYMRQLALIVIMAQMGCFVPAESAKLPIFDRIFTRIGAADDLISGQSTFMVEMMETNLALQQATEKSLLLFDEIGRGTATYDGMALAEAILKYVHRHVRAKSIFSTHYHELTQLEQEIDSLKNIHVGAVEQNGQLIFLHHIQDGPADKSYGLHVAQLAGLPQELIQEASDILYRLETQQPIVSTRATEQTLHQINHIMPQSKQNVLEQLDNVDVNNLTPMNALLLIQQLKQQLSE